MASSASVTTSTKPGVAGQPARSPVSRPPVARAAAWAVDAVASSARPRAARVLDLKVIAGSSREKEVAGRQAGEHDVVQLKGGAAIQGDQDVGPGLGGVAGDVGE